MTHLKKRDAEKPFHSLYQTITDNRRRLSWLKYLHIFANYVSLLHKMVQQNLVQSKEEARLILYVRACARVCVRVGWGGWGCASVFRTQRIAADGRRKERGMGGSCTAAIWPLQWSRTLTLAADDEEEEGEVEQRSLHSWVLRGEGYVYGGQQKIIKKKKKTRAEYRTVAPP